MRTYREIPPTVRAVQWEGDNIHDFESLNGLTELTLRPLNEQVNGGAYELRLTILGLGFVLQPYQWLVRQNGVCSVMSNEDFRSKYEPAPCPCVP